MFKKKPEMIKKLFLFFILLIFPIIGYSSEKINLEDYINSFSWSKRIVLFITKKKYVHFINETDEFFKKNKCENKLRNLKYIRIIGNDVHKYILPDKYKDKYGIWLIGYDSQDKAYSNDISLLKTIYNLIDAMPLRKEEMNNNSEQNKKCKK